MAMVIPRARSSGALSMLSKLRYSASPLKASTFVIAAVSVVLPWSTCPIVPTFTCGFVRSNFFFAMAVLRFPVPGSLFQVPQALAELGTGNSELSLRQCAGNLRRRLRIVTEFLARTGAPLRHRAQVGCVAEQLCQRHLGAHDLRAAHRLRGDDVTASPGDIAHHIAEEVLRRAHFDLEDGFEDHRIRLSQRRLEGLGGRHFEGDLGGVDLVEAAIDGGNGDVDDRIAGNGAALQRLFNTGLDRRDILARDRAADDLVLELEALASLARLDRQLDV